MDWERVIRERLQGFASSYPGAGIPVSIKFRVSSGCFHREHSPRAYAQIDQAIATLGRRVGNLELVEHETGPELLVRLGLVTAGLTLATSLIQLVVAILQARSAGVTEGDRPDEPVELIVRRVLEDGRYEETVIVKTRYGQQVRVDEIKGLLGRALDPKARTVGRPEADPAEPNKAALRKRGPRGRKTGHKGS